MHVGPNEAIEGQQMGDLVIWEDFLDPKGIILTGNDTTVYGMIFLDLDANGPMVVDVPPSPFLGSVLDLWQVPLAGIDANGAKFVVVPADFPGELDMPDGYTLLRSRTSVAVFFARGLVIEGDVEGAVKTVTNSKVYPLSQINNPPELTVHLATGVDMDTISPMDPQVYWERVAEVMNFVDPEADQDASLMISLLEPLGVAPGQAFAPDERQKQILSDAAHFGWIMAQTISYAPRFDNIIYYPGTRWEWVLELDPSLQERFWRDLEARTNYYFQASMAQPAMKEKKIGAGSQYLRSARDAAGVWLDGTNTYKLNVPANPPAELFWSITLYDVETRSQVLAPSNNAALSSYDDLRYNEDGSVDLYFGPKAPDGYENNWVETLPGRGWWVWFRFYSPAEAFFDKSWQLTDFERLQ
ncbi:DUF1254 domain-containing protein [Parasedimentitalea psychrophila]|uniref:DUF1254 domain-containing protein n=2 Tax=Parasedimentitalea psychrophila TaxID=2997337 RepID=A0A9Y2L0W5_9RHOB|nr:DUF1254 domain-containing protein [Parasedimentitalea psychrophila]WIY24814.1 DUF1254 domain-containing protein [Parasedimentitalea psychrophila]